MPWFRTKLIVCIFWEVCRPHTGITNNPQRYEITCLLKTYRSYPLKVVIFRGRFFKAQHAMVSNKIAYLYFLGFVLSPHRNDPYHPKIRKRVSAQKVSIIPLKSCHFPRSFFKGPTCHGFERCRRDTSFRVTYSASVAY